MTGNELKLRVYALGRTQKEIADQLGVTPQSLSAVFNAADVRSGTVERIAHALGVTVASLYGEDTPTPVREESRIDRIVENLVDELTDTVRKRIMKDIIKDDICSTEN